MNSWKATGSLSLVLAVMAVAGTGTAQATQACANAPAQGHGCPAGKDEYAGEVSMSGLSWTVTNSITDVTCSIGGGSISIFGSTGFALAASIVSLQANVFSCKTASGTACEVTTVNLPYEASIEGTTLTVKDPVGAGFKIVCGFLINCTFTTNEGKAAIENGSPTKVSGAWTMNRTGGLCPATAQWDFSFASTSPAGFTILT